MMKQIILREASDTLDALQIAQGMENVGADVFSITHNGMGFSGGYKVRPDQEPVSKFVVCAKFEAPLTPDMIDEAISAAYDAT